MNKLMIWSQIINSTVQTKVYGVLYFSVAGFEQLLTKVWIRKAF